MFEKVDEGNFIYSLKALCKRYKSLCIERYHPLHKICDPWYITICVVGSQVMRSLQLLVIPSQLETHRKLKWEHLWWSWLLLINSLPLMFIFFSFFHHYQTINQNKMKHTYSYIYDTFLFICNMKV